LSSSNSTRPFLLDIAILFVEILSL